MRKISILVTSLAIISGCGGGSGSKSGNELYQITNKNFDRATSVAMAATDDLPLISYNQLQNFIADGCIDGSYTQKDIDGGVDFKFNNCKTSNNYVINGELIYKTNNTLSVGKGGYSFSYNSKGYASKYNFISGLVKFDNSPDETITNINNLKYKININSHYIDVDNFNFNNSNNSTHYITSSDIIDNKKIDVSIKGNKRNSYIIINIKGANNSSIKIETTEENSYENYKIFLNNKEILKDKSNSEKEKAIDKRSEYFLN